ncbi:MAG: DUF6159 family protein [Bacteroidota bacterium]
MNLFDRLGRGWNLGIQSLEIISEHPKLLLFPVLSGSAMVAIVLSFFGAFLGMTGANPELMNAFGDKLEQLGEVAVYGILFLFYLISYFIVIFFNVALVHNARLIFAGEAPSIRAGIQFSSQRAASIFAWAALAATVGLVLKAIEDKLGSLVSGLLGFAWSLATYFVVPTLAAEDIGPFDALRRSSRVIRERWGESIGAGFSLGLFFLVGIVLAIIIGFVTGQLFHPGIGVAFGVLTFMLTNIINGAARNIFLAAAYEHTQGNTPQQFDHDTLDGVFMQK